MDASAFPIGAVSLSSLMSHGPTHPIGEWPIDAACRVTMGGVDSIWVDMGHPVSRGRIDFAGLWRQIHPTLRIPPGYEVRPLMSADDARRADAQFVRVDLVAMHTTIAEGYVLTGVQHSARDHSY